MILSYICFIVAFILFCIECHANIKRKQIETVRQKIHKPLADTNIQEATMMGTTAVGISLFEVYATMNKHSEILDVLEQRFPDAHGVNIMMR